MKTNPELLKLARASLKGKWGIAIATFLVYNIMIAGGGLFHDAGNVVALIIGGPLALGAATFSLAVARGQEAKFDLLFDGFKDFGNALATYLLMLLFVILWALLLIIPGIIAALSYSMTFYILSDDRTLKPREAIDKSKLMMDGHKMKLFNLFLRFFLLALLCILTLGIGFLWLIPYTNVTMAHFYEDVKHGKIQSEFV